MSSLLHRISIFSCVFLLSTFSALGQTGLVVSQVYGGGGNSGATYSNDFIELYNSTNSPISLNGLSVQYASATGSSWNAATLPNVSLAANHFYLIEAAAGSTPAMALPTPDLILTLSNVSQSFVTNLSATAGKVALVSNTTPLTSTCPTGAAILDFVGYGSTANCSEGNAPAPTTSNNAQSIIRKVAGTDTNNNAADFTTISPPNPRNSGSSAVTPPVSVVAIHTIQGVKSTTAATVSPYAGQQVTTTGVVTSVLSNGFFMQSRDVDADTNPLTPEGIEVFTSSAPSAAAAIGNLVQVTGTVTTYPAVTASHIPATELNSPMVTLVSTGNALPTAVTLTTAMLTPGGGLYQLTPYEGMRVAVPSITAVSGTNGSITSANEATETATSTGYFYGVITGTPRPFREPGIDIRDTPVQGEPADVPRFDDNPERILIDSVIAGGSSIEISTGAVLSNVTGVLDFTFSSDSFYDPSRLILDGSYNRANVIPGITVEPAPLPAATEFTVAHFNIERFYNPAQAVPDDLYYVPAGVVGYNGSSSTGTVSTGQTFISEAVDVTAAAYQRRLQKVSLAIRNVLNSPDVVTLEEVENQNVANDIAAQVNTDAGIPNLYTAYSTDNSTYFTQDGTGISVGFLVKNTVDNLGFTQFGQGQTFTPSSSTSLVTLNDRPWLVLNAGIKRANAKDYPVTVIVNHMKALTGENSTTSTSTRQKKELQAEDIAKYIQTLQASGQHVISGGDFNAFEFSDGYTDTLATYTNVNVLPANEVVQPGVPGLVTPPLTDLALLLPANQRWSYVEDGDAQILDHIVVTADLVAAGAHMAYAHLDADFPLTAYNDATTPARTSDHDAAVGYYVLPAPVASASLTPAMPFSATPVGTSSSGQVFTFTNTGDTAITLSGITATGDFAVSSTCPAILAFSSSCTLNVIFTPTATGARAGVLTIGTNLPGTTLNANLSGTGLTPPPPPAPIYVADSSRVQRFTVDGLFSSQFSITGNGRFLFGPAGLAVDTQGDTFLTDGFNKNVSEFDGNGSFVRSFGSFGTGNGQFANGLGGLTVDPAGNVLVADTGNDRIEKFSSSGVYLGQFGSRGHDNGQFVSPVSVVTDAAGHIFVADSSRVQEFTNDGQYLQQVNLTGNGGFLFGPGGLSVDARGDLFVIDTGAKTVTEFDPNGNLLQVLGSYGSGNGQFLNGLSSIAVDGSGNLLAGDSGNNRVQSFGATGSYQSQFGSPGSGPGQFSNGALFVAVTH